MKRRLPFLIFISGCLIFSACSKQNGGSPESHYALPLKEGNYWVYIDSGIIKSGGSVVLDTLRVIAKVDHLQGNYFTVGSQRLLLPKLQDIYRSDQGSIYRFSEEENTELCLFKKVGSRDTISVREYEYTEFEVKHQQTVYQVGYPQAESVNGQTCYRNEHLFIDHQNRLVRQEIYYVSPRLGIVKLIVFGYDYSYFPEGYQYLVRQFDLFNWTLSK